MFETFNQRYSSASTLLPDSSSVIEPHEPHSSDPDSRHTEVSRLQTHTPIDRTLNYILTDCFFSLGQGVADRKSIDHTAIIWIHDYYRAQFFRTITMFGKSWLRDRHRVKGVSRMLGERAAHYAQHNASIDLAAVLQASADVRRYCTLYARRRRRLSRDTREDEQTPRLAGTWCDPDDPLPTRTPITLIDGKDQIFL